MKKYFLQLLLLPFGLFAQTPTWEWLTKSIGSDYVGSRSISLDNNGNVYTVGNYSTNTFNYGGLTLTNTSLSTARDSYVAKHNSLGEIIWLKGISGINNEEILKVNTDNNNNVYILGAFNSPNITIGSTTLTNSGYYDIYLAKLNSDGDLIWVKSISGTDNESAEGLTVDSSGNVYVGGRFSSTSITIGTTVLNNATTSGAGFLLKFDSLGNPIWNKVINGSIYDYVEAVSVDSLGNVFIAGGFNSPTLSFDTTVLNNTNNYKDIFIAKYNSTGIFQWAKKIGGTDDDDVRNIKLDNVGNLYLTGHFSSPVLTLGTTTLTRTSTQDIFLTKYNTNGNLLWAKKAGNSSYNVSTGLTIDSDNNSYISGAYFNSITFENLPQLVSQGNQDVFLTKYDATGNAIWSKSNGGIYNDFGFALTSNQSNEVFLTGTIGPQCTPFDDINAYTNTSYNFISKLSSATLSNQDFISNNVSIYPNPVNEDLNILSLDNIHNKKYQIINALGRIITESYLDNYSNSIPVNFLQSGIYFLKIEDYEAIKFIKN
ncbi:T9SS type A sorting domain-containing protein [Flavobacterium sp. F372]|uniref:T9SS type A sorting domain-containing protein n=1 Tax=Flavobacterium bernardetii TaxID=2813823 RepID=A0ABR7IXH3_9FLAO|nr:T9SS type A sorting domain-containing protein [Flavobacterium bernardetii]MBC5834480.1 T9SS type A sorting domain-containing protein [Flavobacterium bernardetii]NHF69881.1 T9SS type A sorting domain-containing protein [Flavobacterium bernardetii]